MVLSQQTLVALFVSALLILVNGQSNPSTTFPFTGYRLTGVGGARGLFIDDNNDILVMSRTNNGIMCVYEAANGQTEQVKIINGDGLGLNHGLTMFRGYIYASSSTTVYRWPYVTGSRALVTAPSELVITGIPTGGHNTRTLIFDPEPRVLYVSIGSQANVDNNSDRSRIMRYNLFDGPPPGGINWRDGELFADGLRNEVGLDFDSRGVLWGVENGADQLNRPDIGGDIHNGNPAEEFNRFNCPPGTHYGYPYCFSTHNLPGYSANTQFAWPSFMNDGVHTDEWCRNLANNQPPVLAMGAHMAPLGVTFYDGRGCGSKVGSMPCELTGDAFVAFHGSWNSDVKVGYKVTWFTFDKNTGEPTGTSLNPLFDPDVNCNNCFTPVNVVFDYDGYMIVSTDSSHDIFKIFHTTIPTKVIRNE